jgi:2-polyprenyl-3-methyl-5-hydroxy-6-metoxy-1,4-benzoquinol methylase
MEYRKILYNRYHSTQSGRLAPMDVRNQFENESWRFEREIIPLIRDLPKSARILDIGCGNGSLVYVLQKNGYEHTEGVDISPEQVEIAQKMGVKNIRCQDIREVLAETENQYDLILGMDIVEHFTKNELTELLLALRGKLSKEGRALFRTPNMDALVPNKFSYGDFTHECLLNPSSATQLGLACGYKEVRVFAGDLSIRNPLKELLRKLFWTAFTLEQKIKTFASGSSTQGLIHTPNLLWELRK